MKLTKYIVLSLLAVATLTMAQPVLASEATQEQELIQECKLLCESSGAYGQDTTCTNECYQKGIQKQTITLSDGTVIYSHEAVNAGLDISTASAIASLVIAGTLATITRRKLV